MIDVYHMLDSGQGDNGIELAFGTRESQFIVVDIERHSWHPQLS